MKSYSTLLNLYQELTKNFSSGNQTLGAELLNDGHRELIAQKDFAFLHRARTLSSVASTQFLPLPYDIDLVESVTYSAGGTVYTPKLVHSREEWTIINAESYESDTPIYAHVYNGEIGFYPTPATSSNTITINGKIRVPDLSEADYTTGTITTATAGDETIVGSGTTFTASMVGRYLRIPVAQAGDGIWYEIGSFTSTTSIELVRKYGGTSIAAGSATYAIGQMPIVPESFHIAPVHYAASVYWDREGDARRATRYEKRFDDAKRTLDEQYSAYITDPVLDESADEEDIINPNLTIQL